MTLCSEDFCLFLSLSQSKQTKKLKSSHWYSLLDYRMEKKIAPRSCPLELFGHCSRVWPWTRTARLWHRFVCLHFLELALQRILKELNIYSNEWTLADIIVLLYLLLLLWRTRTQKHHQSDQQHRAVLGSDGVRACKSQVRLGPCPKWTNINDSQASKCHWVQARRSKILHYYYSIATGMQYSTRYPPTRGYDVWIFAFSNKQAKYITLLTSQGNLPNLIKFWILYVALDFCFLLWRAWL